MRLRRLPLEASVLCLLLVQLVVSGCVSDDHATWWIGDVAPDWNDCRATAGTHAVLDLQEFRGSLVIPFAWGGFRLFLLTVSKHLEPGTILTIPGDKISAILCDLSHGGADDAIRDVEGSVRVLRQRGQDVFLRLDLVSERGDWSYHSEQWFERRDRPVERPRFSD